MALPLASVEDLEDRIGADFSTEEEATARVFLQAASAWARHFGASWPNPVLVPDVVRAIVIEVAARGFMNPEGFQLERGDEVTFQREASHAAGAAFTDREISAIASAAGRGGLQSVKARREVRLIRT